MRILFVTMQFGGPYTQGTERYVGSLAEGLRGRGHAVAFLAGDPLGTRGRRRLGEVVDAEVPIHALPSHGWTAVRGMEPARLARWLEEHKPDLIHVANPAHVGCGIIGAAGAVGIPCVVTTMDFWWVCPKATLLRADGGICDGTPGWAECVQCSAGDHPRGLARRLGRLPNWMAPLALGAYAGRALLRGGSARDVMRWTRRRDVTVGALNAARHVIFPSRATERVIRPRLAHDRCSVIPYGLGAEWFRDRRAPGGSVREPSELTIGYAGAMLPHKGPHLLLEAVRRLGWTGARVRMAGPMDDEGYAASLRAAATGLNVEFCGRLASTEMPGFLRSLDVLTMTSVWPENLPFIVLEAQAAGVPVVGSDLDGVAEQIGDPELLFRPGSAEELAGVLERVRCHPARVIAPVRTLEEMVEATEAVYAAR